MSSVPQFESWEEFRAKSEFFPAGRIVPKRLMDIRYHDGKRFKHHHRFTFGVDVWVYHSAIGIKFIVPFGGERALEPDENCMSLIGFRSNTVRFTKQSKRRRTRLTRGAGSSNLRVTGAPYAEGNYFVNSSIGVIENFNTFIQNNYSIAQVKGVIHA